MRRQRPVEGVGHACRRATCGMRVLVEVVADEEERHAAAHALEDIEPVAPVPVEPHVGLAGEREHHAVEGVERERQEDAEDLEERQVGVEGLSDVTRLHRLRGRNDLALERLRVRPEVLDEEHADREDARQRVELLEDVRAPVRPRVEGGVDRRSGRDRGAQDTVCSLVGEAEGSRQRGRSAGRPGCPGTGGRRPGQGAGRASARKDGSRRWPVACSTGGDRGRRLARMRWLWSELEGANWA